MSSTVAFLASFVSILIGAVAGMVLKRSLPVSLLEGGSKEAVRLGARLSRDACRSRNRPDDCVGKNTFDTQARTYGNSAPMRCWSTRC